MTNVLVTGDLTVIGTDNTIPNPTIKCAVMSDEKASTTGGGNSAVGIQNRTLNTLTDPSNLITLDGGYVTFTFNETGTYSINAQIPGYRCNRHNAYLTQSDNTVKLRGCSEYAFDGGDLETCSLIADELVVTSTSQAYKLRQYCQAVKTNGLGYPVGSGAGESYTKLTVIKISD